MPERDSSAQPEIERHLLAIRVTMHFAVRLCVLWVCLSVGRLIASFTHVYKDLLGTFAVVGRQPVGLG